MFPKMTQIQWNDTAARFANHMAQFKSLVERGVAPIRFLEESTMSDVTDCPVVVGVFANNNDQGFESQREIDLVRDRLKEIEASELGAGVNDDGSTWALLVGVETSRYQTIAGQTVQRELFKAFLEEAIWAAWRQIQYEQIKHALDAASTT
jgi:hypothetical protein